MKKFIFMVSCFFLMISNTWALTLSCEEVASIGDDVSCTIEEDEYIGVNANIEVGEEFLYKEFKNNSSWKKYYTGNLGFSLGNVINSDKLEGEILFKVSDKAVNNQEYVIKLANIEVVNSSYQNVKLDNVSSKIKILSNDNRLKSLEVSEGKLSPQFSSDVTSYKMSVDSDKLVIKATPFDEGAVVSGDVGEKTLAYGVNNFVINVTSARGEVRKYYLYVTRNYPEVKKSNDITLKSLKFNGKSIKLEDNNYLYNVSVSYDVNEMNVEVILNSDKASYKILKPDSLVVGENNIVIMVTAEDGSVGKYVLVVDRGEKKSSDASIKSLEIDGYEIEFKSDVFDYQLKIGNEDSLDIKVVLNDSKAKYTISGNKNLVNKSIINIQVVAEDGSFLNYQIKVLKDDVKNSSLIVNGGSLVTLVGLVVLVVLVIVVKIFKDRSVGKDK